MKQNCKDLTDIMFPIGTDILDEDIAKKLCYTCPSLQPCATVKNLDERHGIWFGTSPDDRAAIRKRKGLTDREVYAHAKHRLRKKFG